MTKPEKWIERVVRERNEALAQNERLAEALKGLLELCDHANAGAFKNGVTDATGSIDEGDYIAMQRMDAARAALKDRP
jgi:hypothetical protein